MKRRTLIKTCGASMALAQLAPLSFIRPNLVLAAEEYGKSRLLGQDGKPLKASSIPAHTNLIFFYPFTSTPCFLLNLDKEIKPVEVHTLENTYPWPGGVGKNRSIVAYTAICSHSQTHPMKQGAQIRYETGRNIIHCCSHRSDFFPGAGAALNEDGKADLSKYDGAAEAPLASILLEWDETSDELTATGILGPDRFSKFFRRFRKQLRKQYGSTDAAKEPIQESRVQLLTDYSGGIEACREADD